MPAYNKLQYSDKSKSLRAYNKIYPVDCEYHNIRGNSKTASDTS
jgi:hypothetical protein